MRLNSIVVLDIETVKDPLVLQDWSESKWPPPVGWRIVAIGMVAARIIGQGTEKTFEIEAITCGAGEERELLKKFWPFFERRQPTVVTWNGRGFDMPVLIQRSLIHRIAAATWFQAGDRWDSYPYRYAPDRHCDLMDQLSDFGACQKMSMDLVARAMGLPGKIGGCGADVEAMFMEGEIESIRAYCEGDVINLYGIFLGWALLTGRISRDCYNRAVEHLAGYLSGHVVEKPHFAEFMRRWRSGPRLLAAE